MLGSAGVEQARVSVSDRVSDVAIARADACESVGVRNARFARVKMAGRCVSVQRVRVADTHIRTAAKSALSLPILPDRFITNAVGSKKGRLFLSRPRDVTSLLGTTAPGHSTRRPVEP